MAKEERVQVEEVPVATESAPEKSKKGLNVMLLIVGLVAILQCGVLIVIFQEEIMTFFEGMKPEPVEVIMECPLEEISVNLADKGSRHFLRAKISLKYIDGDITTAITEKQSDIRATVTEYLRSKTFDEVNSVEGTRIMEDELVQLLNETLETDAFTKVLFTDIVAQ